MDIIKKVSYYAMPRLDYVLILNFGVNIIVWSIVLKYSYFESLKNK